MPVFSNWLRNNSDFLGNYQDLWWNDAGITQNIGSLEKMTQKNSEICLKVLWGTTMLTTVLHISASQQYLTLLLHKIRCAPYYTPAQDLTYNNTGSKYFSKQHYYRAVLHNSTSNHFLNQIRFALYYNPAQDLTCNLREEGRPRGVVACMERNLSYSTMASSWEERAVPDSWYWPK